MDSLWNLSKLVMELVRTHYELIMELVRTQYGQIMDELWTYMFNFTLINSYVGNIVC